MGKDDRSAERTVDRGEEAICHEGIQAHLLHQTESHVTEKMPGDEKVAERMVGATEKESHDDNCENTRQKNGGRAFGGDP